MPSLRLTIVKLQDIMGTFTMKIYLDYAATTPTAPDVIKAMEPYFFEKFGNASSPHSIGQEASAALESSRDQIARFIGAKAEEIVFNSGATEGANHVIFNLARSLKEKGRHIIVSPLEHHCVLEPIEMLKHEGFKVTYLSADANGFINPLEVKKYISNETILVAVMHASNEIGTIEPIAEIGKVTKELKVPLLVDAVQSVGHNTCYFKEI
jgi:cysteine desulfurase